MSSITLYENCALIPSRNMTCDDIETYLSTLSKRTFSDLNFFKIKIKMEVKLVIPESALEMGYLSQAQWNYAKIINESGQSAQEYYFFIIDYEFTSKEVVKLILEMDTISTFQLGTDYYLTDKTLIHREHKDRWTYDEETQMMDAIIHRESEGILPVLYKENEQQIYYKNSAINQKWYVVYENENDIEPTDYNQVNPVVMKIYPQYPIKVSEHTDLQLDALGFAVGYTYIISTLGYNSRYCPLTIEADSTPLTVLEQQGKESYYQGRVYQFLEIRKASSGSTTLTVKLKEAVVNDSGTATYTTTLTTLTGVTYIEFQTPPDRVYYYTSQNEMSFVSSSTTPSGYWNMNGTAKPVISVDAIDKTNSKLIKIVELPYCPLRLSEFSPSGAIMFQEKYTIENGAIILSKDYLMDYPYKRVKLNSEINFNHSMWDELESMYASLGATTTNLIPAGSVNRDRLNGGLETNLFHSDYFNIKIVYDSFNCDIKPEYCDMHTIAYGNSNNTDDVLKLMFYVSTTVVSKFGFKIDLDYFKAPEDYPLFIAVARNNEEPIYSSQYINYLRTGYNYDLKAKHQQAVSSGIGVGMSVLGAIGGVGLGIASENPAIAVGAVLSAITSVTASVTSAVNSSISSQNAIEQKLAQAKAQAVTVQGSDDLDLLNAYTEGNRAKLVLYQVSDVMKSNLEKLFFYTGYRIEKMGIPDLTSRKRFNYIQADIDFKALHHIPADIVQDIKARYQMGLTIIHKYSASTVVYDFNQAYENWEVLLEEALY